MKVPLIKLKIQAVTLAGLESLSTLDTVAASLAMTRINY